jgi:sodium/potassium-transporting ATPase subunit alpha
MDSDKPELSEKKTIADIGISSDVSPAVTQTPAAPGVQQRIGFAPTLEKPDRTKEDADAAGLTAAAPRRPSIPRVISEEENKRYTREKKEEKKNVDIDEHLLPHQEVAERYHTKISIEKPGASFGLSPQQVEQFLQEYGPNVLTPPKKRHPFLKYLDCLRSLFNLLLIFSGILEYVLLGINFHDNIQNVRIPSVYVPKLYT